MLSKFSQRDNRIPKGSQRVEWGKVVGQMSKMDGVGLPQEIYDME